MEEKKQKKIIIALPLWNKNSIDYFFKNILPLQFTEDNLKFFKQTSYSAIYYIYTFNNDIKLITKSENFKKLQEIINVKIISIDQDFLSQSHFYKQEKSLGITLAYNMSIQSAAKQKAALIFINPDHVFHESFFRKILFFYEKGYSLIGIPVTHLQEETFMPNFILELRNQQKQNLSSTDLIKIALQHIHSSRKSMYWTKNRKISKSPDQIYWDFNEKALLIKSFQIHPIFIDLENINKNEIKPIDGYDSIDKIWQIIKIEKSKQKLIDDSNDLSLFKVYNSIEKEPEETTCKTMYHVSFYAKNYDSNNINFFENCSFFLHEETENILDNNLINKSKKIAQKILKQIYQPNVLTRFFWLMLNIQQYPSKTRYFLKILLKIINLFLYPLVLVLKIFKIRIINLVHVNGIGHLVAEPEFYIKEHYPFSKKRTILFCPLKKICKFFPQKIVCNRSLVEYWKKYFTIITSPWLNLLLLPFKKNTHLLYNSIKYFDPGKSNLYEINIKNNKKVLDLNEKHHIDGKEILSKLKIPNDAWYVCFNARSYGFNKEHDELFLYRNSDTNTLFLALKEIEKRGGWCIRIGNRYPQKLSNKFQELKHFVDYSNSPYVSDWMDLFLTATCKFFIGSSISGISNLPMLFNVPCVLVNVLPLTALPHKKTDLAIFKNYYSLIEKRMLTIPEILSSSVANSIHSNDYINNNIIPINNTAKEIKDIVIEMLERQENNNKNIKANNDQLQLYFKNLFEPCHLCYQLQSDIGSKFLKKYSNLIKIQ